MEKKIKITIEEHGKETKVIECEMAIVSTANGYKSREIELETNIIKMDAEVGLMAGRTIIEKIMQLSMSEIMKNHECIDYGKCEGKYSMDAGKFAEILKSMNI